MNLTAIITSEKAFKVQSGKKFLRASFCIGETEVMMIVLDDKGVFTIRDKNHDVFKVIQVKDLLLSEQKKVKNKKSVCSAVDCTTVVELKNARYLDGLPLCDTHAAQADGY